MVKELFDLKRALTKFMAGRYPEVDFDEVVKDILTDSYVPWYAMSATQRALIYYIITEHYNFNVKVETYEPVIEYMYNKLIDKGVTVKTVSTVKGKVFLIESPDGAVTYVRPLTLTNSWLTIRRAVEELVGHINEDNSSDIVKAFDFLSRCENTCEVKQLNQFSESAESIANIFLAPVNNITRYKPILQQISDVFNSPEENKEYVSMLKYWDLRTYFEDVTGTTFNVRDYRSVPDDAPVLDKLLDDIETYSYLIGVRAKEIGGFSGKEVERFRSTIEQWEITV